MHAESPLSGSRWCRAAPLYACKPVQPEGWSFDERAPPVEPESVAEKGVRAAKEGMVTLREGMTTLRQTRRGKGKGQGTAVVPEA
jgi:hypothetical protein